MESLLIIVSVLGGVWYMTSRLESRINKLDDRLHHVQTNCIPTLQRAVDKLIGDKDEARD